MALHSIPVLLSAVLLLVAGEPRYLVLKNGLRIRAEVIKVEGEQAFLKVNRGSRGMVEETYFLSDFVPQSAFHILHAVTPENDAMAHLELAMLAADHGLTASARRELSHARKLNGDKKFAPEIEKRIVEKSAEVLERLIREKVVANDLDDARRLVGSLVIRFPDTAPAKNQNRLLDLIEKKRAENRHTYELNRAKRENAKAAKDRAAKLAPAAKSLARAKSYNRKGLTSAKSFSTALAHFKRAISGSENASRLAALLIRKHKNDREILHDAERIKKEAESLVKQSHLNAGSLYLTRGQYTAAMGQVGAVLALDPRHKQALAMRARIEIAANQDRWGYRRRRRIGR